MKRILLMAITAMMFSAVAAAQDTPVNKMKKQPPVKTGATTTNQPDYIVMKDGRIIAYSNNKESDVTEDVVLGNGTVVMRDGTLKMKDGKTIKLNNGESIDRSGLVTPTPAAKPPLDQTPPNPTPINPSPTPTVPPVKTTNPVTPPTK